MVVKIGFIKLGNLGTSQVIDLLLDEIAQREGIAVRTLGTGAKMGKDEASATKHLKEIWKPDFVVMISPNASAPGPTAAREIYKDIPTIVISDGPTKKDARKALEEAGFGYIILPVDPLIGAKREFLDPAEMVLFNSDAAKVLSVCGAIRLVQEEIDKVVAQVAEGEEIKLPHILAKPDKCVERMDFSNPYAKAKALAALHLAEKVAEINFQACFVIKDAEKVALTAATGHEVMRVAAQLADEARELEKSNDTVSRKPHAKSGKLLSKVKLLEPPK
ncbi:MAG: F420-dependent methylenetetrahydromethanopterin dehydrogenase [Methanosarcinales archaeon]